MSLRRIGLVAWQVFREGVRDRVVYAIGLFALVVVAVSLLIGQLSAGEDVKIVKDIGLATIELGGAVVSVVIGVGLVAREIERRSIFSLLAKPLDRWEFVVGKYLGLLLTILANVAAMTAILYGVLAVMGWQATPTEQRAWDAAAVDSRLLLAVVMITAELALLTALGLFFSTFSSSTLVSVVLTAGLFVAGLLSADLRGYADIASVPPAVARVVSAIGWAIPAFSAFNIKAQVVHGLSLPAGFVWYTIAYAAFYVTALVAAAVAIFARREFR
jgi:ABC-type transport system involved in multi-copper enzyme maturation permease subunit